MTQKEKALYAPGELSRVREKLNVDQDEAKRMAEILGGEVGYERSDEQESSRKKTKSVRHERVDVKIGGQPDRIPGRRVELALDSSDEYRIKKPKRQRAAGPEDDPSVILRPNFWERVKMDKYAGQSQFDIKSPGQILFSMFSIFGDIPDFINPRFTTVRMKEYYKKLETLVVVTRALFPRNNIRRNNRMKTTAPLAFVILDAIRYWNIEKISSELAKLQTHPKNAKVTDYLEILRAVYRPFFVLEQMDMEAHIRGSFKVLYKVLYIENPTENQAKNQDMIRTALTAYNDVNRDIRYLMHPLLMKAVSAKWLPYDRLFIERKNRIMALLKVTPEDQIDPAQIIIRANAEQEDASGTDEEDKKEEAKEETPEEHERRMAIEGEKKALERGLQTMEAIFPNAGWDRLSTYPDLYPYFADMFDLRKGFVNIAPTDPLQQIYILMRIISEFFYGLRFVSFGTITGQDGHPEALDKVLPDIINNWQYYIENSYDKTYLPRLMEYVRLLEGSPEEWNSPYTKKTISDLHWIKRLYFLPFYRFESFSAPPFQKKDITQIYPEIKKLRRYLAALGANIELANRAGGAEQGIHCEGINNPWENYVFQVPNPVSTRIDALLPPKRKNNASLIYFVLSVVTVLDHLINNEDSWAYGSRPGPLFRSVGGEGATPLTGVDARIDADALFKAALKKRQKT